MARFCRARGCTSEIRDAHFYCGRDWRNLGEQLVTAVENVYPDAARIYLGRTNYPERRLLEHRVKFGLKRLAVLHWAGCKDEIAEVEEWLIASFKGERKLENTSDASEGGWYGHWNCVYVAWRPKEGAARWPGTAFERVSELDLGHRLVPDRSFQKVPDLLETELSVDGAKKVLDRHWKQ